VDRYGIGAIRGSQEFQGHGIHVRERHDRGIGANRYAIVRNASDHALRTLNVHGLACPAADEVAHAHISCCLGIFKNLRIFYDK